MRFAVENKSGGSVEENTPSKDLIRLKYETDGGGVQVRGWSFEEITEEDVPEKISCLG